MAKKIGMTQIFNDIGEVVPVTVLQVYPCLVTDKKSQEKHRYQAVQLGYDATDAKKVAKPHAGQFLKKKIAVQKNLIEFRTSAVDAYQIGDRLTVNELKVGDTVDVAGISKGKGFQGVMKRYHFSGGHKTHGCSISHRAPGSIGQRTWPGKVIKGKKMPGRMGNDRVTMKNLSIVGVEAEKNIILIHGAVPGANHSDLEIKAHANAIEKRYLERKKSEPLETSAS